LDRALTSNHYSAPAQCPSRLSNLIYAGEKYIGVS